MSTPTAGIEPHRPTTGGPLAPTASGQPAITLTRSHKILIGVVAVGAIAIAGIGFAGSYHAVTALAAQKGFGKFAHVFTIGVDVGIGVFLALDLLLTWLRMPYPLLRQGAWLLTAATIAFNAATAWPDPIGVSMHAVIPVLFVIAVEAARHAIGRIADITADKYLEGPKAARWFLNPVGTFVLWRRQRLWEIRTWDAVLKLERERRVYVAQLRRRYGRAWRRKAPADQLLVIRLATKDGLSISEAIKLPEEEARRLAEEKEQRETEARTRAEAEAEAKRRTEAEAAEAEANRRIKAAEAEAAEARARAEAEAAAEVARIEVEAKRLAEAEAVRLLVAETEAKLAAVALEQQEAEAEAKLNRQRRAAEEALLQAEADRRAREQQAEEDRLQREEEARARAQRLVAEVTTSGSASAPASGSEGTAASASGPDSKAATASAPTSGSASPAPNARTKKKAAEVQQLLLRMVEADDPKCVSLADVQAEFGLKQAAAYDRLVTARDLYARAKNTERADR
ncbi:DUF2637 domain-containing protein [Streptomyces sp. M2CJ-2]|uniref:DUF2637 domain-containing protein n=1 Tax=Streptomyces sp. M2CJ-2 TaxID=2803948 RepID=UPI0019261CAC|nr:DUF2637 domain-containing protein [Streptomyces sp. M2CJ-2]MBL3669073.1 DUF2637 domain-containing protein [Streptomyces sp. M2CJ-2]